jgi:hypothetical protein
VKISEKYYSNTPLALSFEYLKEENNNNPEPLPVPKDNNLSDIDLDKEENIKIL